MSVIQKATGLKSRADSTIKRLNEARRKRRDAKRQKTKDKYEKQILREQAKLEKIEEERKRIDSKLRTQKTRKNLKKAKEKQIINKLEDIRDLGGSIKRITNYAWYGNVKGKKR